MKATPRLIRLILLAQASVILFLIAPAKLQSGDLLPLKSDGKSLLPDTKLTPEELRDRWQMRRLLGSDTPSSLGGTSSLPIPLPHSMQTVTAFGNDKLADLLARIKADDRLPEWLKRLDIGVRVGTGQRRVYAETTQPIFQSSDYSHTLFVQGRATLLEGSGIYSGGLGYRKALLDNQVVLGVNTFYDYADRYGHARLGAGAEILSPVAEFRWNIYEPMSNARTVEVRGASRIQDRAAAGYDVEIGAPVPFLPDLKLYGKHQVWDFKHGKDLVRDGGRAEWYLTSFFRIDAESWYDSYVRGWSHRVGFVFRADFDTTFRGTFFRGITKDAYHRWENKDVRWITTYRVVREFDIITERISRNDTG
ncbi:MAG TPA: inverse autotransporter beta domain-containing protein, partial [Nitrospiraceae bacterium]|nr:inverse autotransporter beta domain-containing protein [Nitrospiraceae bacterium]